MNLRRAWDKHADEWIRWARTEGHDHAFWRLNLPHFLDLLPKPRRLTLDIGCGEGRMGRILAQHGHLVFGLDGSPALALAAMTHEDRVEVIAGDAARLPLRDEVCDLAIAMVSLQDVDDLGSAMREAWRVLEPGGRFCFSVVHPVNSAGGFRGDGKDSPFVVSGSYWGSRPYTEVIVREGITMTFNSLHHTLEGYMRPLEETGFLVEAIREPIPDDDLIRDVPKMARWRRVPMFLQVRALKP
ncbi:MAG: methyltransferase domain-containing protein [Actinobacteria bacterium]|nr:methyltransferase domain-containing protein [Actinomycetota bacterium]